MATGSMKRALAPLCGLLLAGALGCGFGTDDHAASLPTAATAQRKPAPAAPLGEAGAGLTPGELRVAWNGEALLVLADAAPRGRVLREVARERGVELVDHATDHGRVSIAQREGTLETLLAGIMGETPFTLHYVGQEGVPQPRTLVVGLAPEKGAEYVDLRSKAEAYAAELGMEIDEVEEALKRASDPEHAARLAEDAARRAAYVPRELSPEQRAAYERERDARRRRAEEENYAATESSDPAERGFAVGTLDPDDPRELPMLARAVDDPDWRVRREAALQLGFGSGADVGDLVARLLRDDNPEVLEPAISAADPDEMPSTRRPLEEIARNHPDPMLQREAERALGN